VCVGVCMCVCVGVCVCVCVWVGGCAKLMCVCVWVGVCVGGCGGGCGRVDVVTTATECLRLSGAPLEHCRKKKVTFWIKKKRGKKMEGAKGAMLKNPRVRILLY
jgi:hypothetical protein